MDRKYTNFFRSKAEYTILQPCFKCVFSIRGFEQGPLREEGHRLDVHFLPEHQFRLPDVLQPVQSAQNDTGNGTQTGNGFQTGVFVGAESAQLEASGGKHCRSSQF
jgi:hypothetical protein